LVEVTFPAEFSTTPCDALSPDSITLGDVLSNEALAWLAEAGGLRRACYKLPAGTDSRISLEQIAGAPGDATLIVPDQALKALLVTSGRCEISGIGRKPDELRRFDMAFIPAGDAARIAATTADFAAMLFRRES
jgi:hypothetical protein